MSQTDIATINTTESNKSTSVMEFMASRFGMDKRAFESIIKKTVMPSKDIRGNPIEATNEQIAAFLSVAKEYNLNPLIKEIFAFAGKGGGIQAIISIDGWLSIINSHPQMDGIVLKENFDDKGDIESVTCTIYRKDRSHPIVVTEYFKECKMGTEPWTKKPVRMTRHKAAIQCGRYAFGFGGIMDEDDYDHMMKDVTPPPRDNTDIKDAFLENGKEEAQPEQNDMLADLIQGKEIHSGVADQEEQSLFVPPDPDDCREPIDFLNNGKVKKENGKETSDRAKMLIAYLEVASKAEGEEAYKKAGGERLVKKLGNDGNGMISAKIRKLLEIGDDNAK